MVPCPCCGTSDKRRTASWPVTPAVDALVARVAELESANAALMAERATYIETHREHEDALAKDLRECRHTLGRVREDLVSFKSRVAALKAENERLRTALNGARSVIFGEYGNCHYVARIDAALAKPEA